MTKIKNYKKLAKDIITAKIPIVYLDNTISEIEKFLSQNEFETLNYIYVVDNEQKLIGVFSIKELFLKPKDKKAKEIMKTNIIKAHPGSAQERVAILALKNNLKSIPIVDKNDKILGVVSSDSILEILHLEDVEDFLRSVGIHSSVRETIRGTPLFFD